MAKNRWLSGLARGLAAGSLFHHSLLFLDATAYPYSSVIYHRLGPYAAAGRLALARSSEGEQEAPAAYCAGTRLTSGVVSALAATEWAARSYSAEASSQPLRRTKGQRAETINGTHFLWHMNRLMGIMLLVLGLAWQQGYAQQLAWEHSLSYTPSTGSVFSYLHQLSTGDFLVSGIKSNNSFPFIYARLQPSGTVVYQRIGRTLATLEQDVIPLDRGGSLLAASVPGRRAGSTNGSSRLFFQRIRPNGDTLPGITYPISFLEGWPTRAVREGDSVRVLTFAYDNQNIGQYALLSTDTLGTVGRVRRYPTPVFGNAYPCDLVRTARGGWLMVGEVATTPYIHPYLVETDIQGRLWRQSNPFLFANSTEERVRRSVNNLIRLRDSSGYVFSGWQKMGSQTFGFLCKLDTALNVVWTYRHPPQATLALNPSRVYELADGTLVWLASDTAPTSAQLTPYLYFIRVSAGGQLVSQQRVSSTDCRLTPYAWQPLAGGGALVVGGTSVCTTTPGTYPAYVARIDNATLLAAAASAAGSPGGATVFPNPARAAVTWQGSVPAGTGTAALQVLDMLGRVVLTVPVSGRGAQVSQELAVRGLAAGTYACCLLVAGQPSGGVCRLVVVP